MEGVGAYSVEVHDLQNRHGIRTKQFFLFCLFLFSFYTTVSLLRTKAVAWKVTNFMTSSFFLSPFGCLAGPCDRDSFAVQVLWGAIHVFTLVLFLFTNMLKSLESFCFFIQHVAVSLGEDFFILD